MLNQLVFGKGSTHEERLKYPAGASPLIEGDAIHPHQPLAIPNRFRFAIVYGDLPAWTPERRLRIQEWFGEDQEQQASAVSAVIEETGSYLPWVARRLTSTRFRAGV